MLGRAALARGESRKAKQLLEQSIAHLREIDEQVSISHEQGDLAYALRATGEHNRVRTLLQETLRKAVKIRAFLPLVNALPAVSLVLADEGESARAVEIFNLASTVALVANSHWFEDVAGKHIAAVAATLPPDVVSAAQQRGRARDLWETAEELLEELEGKADDA
jgi:hypothetical protein